MDADRRGLTAAEAQLLASLDDGFAPEDSVGRPLAAMADWELQAVDALLGRRFCRVADGWNESWWVRLTERGRRRLREPDASDSVS